MKKLAFVASLVLALMAASCSDKSADTTTLRAAAPDSLASAGCNFRYMNVDSVFWYYTLAQELVAEQQKELNALEATARQKESEIQRLGASIENKARNNGYLSEQSYNTDMQTLQQRQQEASQWLNTHQERMARMQMAVQQRLNDSLQNFLKDYNAVYGYDAIFDKSVGFFKPELDITADIVAGLNERYAASQENK